MLLDCPITFISIHVLRVEDDSGSLKLLTLLLLFQSTSSVWRTTELLSEVNDYVQISIHVLRVEDDAI